MSSCPHWAQADSKLRTLHPKHSTRLYPLSYLEALISGQANIAAYYTCMHIRMPTENVVQYFDITYIIYTHAALLYVAGLLITRRRDLETQSLRPALAQSSNALQITPRPCSPQAAAPHMNYGKC